MSRTITLENGSKITISEESYKELSKASKRIMVPKKIKFLSHPKNMVSLKISENQFLTFDKIYGTWEIIASRVNCRNEHELVLVYKKNIEPGRFYYITWARDEFSCLEDLEEYQLYLGNNNWVRVSSPEGKHSLNVLEYNSGSKPDYYYYEVREVNE